MKKYLLAFVISLFMFHPIKEAFAPLNLNQVASTQEFYCMAQNIYWEARSENIEGQVAVAFVVLNRLKNKRYPNTICNVVKEGPTLTGTSFPKRNTCQFSWYCDGLRDEPVKESKSWQIATTLTYEILVLNKYSDPIDGATHYHATYVSPKWATRLSKTKQIGSHIFYKNV
jgi:spore germination cell wall hydrolase CwlJ-like protein